LAPLQIAGMLIAFGALASAFVEGFGARDAKPTQWIGDALGIVAAVLWGLTTLLVRASKLAQLAPEKTLFYQLAWSAPVLAIAAVLMAEPLPAQLNGALAASLFYQSVIVAFASYLVWFWLIRHYPATRIATFGFLTPLFGMLFGALLLNEPITLRLVVALFGVAVGIILVNKSQQH
jgi:drug/metabolite transporter (DMT)-like permease